MAQMMIYRNCDNGNKYLDIRTRADGSIWMRQFMRWDAESSASGKETVNPTGDARLHRIYKAHLRDLLMAYEALYAEGDDTSYRWIQKGLVGRYIKVRRAVR